MVIQTEVLAVGGALTTAEQEVEAATPAEEEADGEQVLQMRTLPLGAVDPTIRVPIKTILLERTKDMER
jgi:hypothetical protein